MAQETTPVEDIVRGGGAPIELSQHFVGDISLTDSINSSIMLDLSTLAQLIAQARRN